MTDSPKQKCRSSTPARDLREGLHQIEPFGSLGTAHINWHVARVASTDSGIDHCPLPEDATDKRTFFGVEGGWNNGGCAGYLGLHHHDRLKWIAEKGCGWENVDLAIVIANCETWGGHSWPHAKTAIITTLPWAFVGLAAHEVGHTVAWLAEESITCIPDDPHYRDPNLTRLPSVGASVKRHLEETRGLRLAWSASDSVWWKGLAKSSELHSNCTFACVHVLGDPVDPVDPEKPKLPAGRPDDVIGAFWGCQDVADVNFLINALRTMAGLPVANVETVIAVLQATTGFELPRPFAKPAEKCDHYWDPRGAYFFRPSPVCCMRKPLPARFCRVCQHLLRNAILEKCGVPPESPLPRRRRSRSAADRAATTFR